MCKYIIHLALILGIISCSVKPPPSETRAEKNALTLQEDTALYLAHQSYSKIDLVDERLQVMEREISKLKLQSDPSLLNRLTFLEQLVTLKSNEILNLNLEISHRILRGLNLIKQGLNSHKHKTLNQAWTFFHQGKYDESAQSYLEWNEASITHLTKSRIWFGEALIIGNNQSGVLDCLHKAVNFRTFQEEFPHSRHVYMY
jgi:hypothetical protein